MIILWLTVAVFVCRLAAAFAWVRSRYCCVSQLFQIEKNELYATSRYKQHVTRVVEMKGGRFDDEISKGEKIVQEIMKRKEAKTQRKIARVSSVISAEDNRSQQPAAAAKSFATRTIWGQNIINCRSFNIDSPKTFEFIGSFKSEASVPTFPVPEIAFLGRSNVGKSSLLNCLTGMNKKIAVESKTPGRTQSINQFKCSDREGDICVFVDLPGYGFAQMAKTQQEEVGIFLQDYLANRGALRLAVLLVDIRREAQSLDLEMLEFLRQEELPFLIIATKADKMKQEEMDRAVKKLSISFGIAPKVPLPFSSITGLGRRNLWRAIKGCILGDETDLSSSVGAMSPQEFDGQSEVVEGEDSGFDEDYDPSRAFYGESSI